MSVVLQTARLVLRPFDEADLDDYARFCADPEVMRYVSAPLSREEAWRQLAMLLGHWQLRGYGMWAVAERPGGKLVGRIGLHRPEGWPDLELGWLLGREYWGRGYGTEGARAALAYAFERLGRADPISLIHPENLASIRLAERLGGRLEGRTVIRNTQVLLFRLGGAAVRSPP